MQQIQQHTNQYIACPSSQLYTGCFGAWGFQKDHPGNPKFEPATPKRC